MQLIIEHYPTILALMATGVFAGILAGLLGVGGGIVIVPVLYFLFQQFGVTANSAMAIATATSLATIIPTSISSIRAHSRKNNVDYGLLKRWSWCILIGVLIGSFAVTIVDGSWLTLMFAIIALFAALNMLFRASKAAIFSRLPGTAGQGVIAATIGLLSSMVGIGGGTLSVPILTACSFPAHKAVGTAAAIGLLISLPGALVMLLFGTTPADAPIFTFGLVNLVGFACIVPLTVLFAPIGAALASRLNQIRLKQVFAIALFITGSRMLVQVLF